MQLSKPSSVAFYSLVKETNQNLTLESDITMLSWFKKKKKKKKKKKAM